MWGYHMGYFPHFWGMILPLICFFILFYVIFTLFRSSGSHEAVAVKRAAGEDSLSLLKNRLAKGEISIEEFEKIKAHL